MFLPVSRFLCLLVHVCNLCMCMCVGGLVGGRVISTKSTSKTHFIYAKPSVNFSPQCEHCTARRPKLKNVISTISKKKSLCKLLTHQMWHNHGISKGKKAKRSWCWKYWVAGVRIKFEKREVPNIGGLDKIWGRGTLCQLRLNFKNI